MRSERWSNVLNEWTVPTPGPTVVGRSQSLWFLCLGNSIELWERHKVKGKLYFVACFYKYERCGGFRKIECVRGLWQNVPVWACLFISGFPMGVLADVPSRGRTFLRVPPLLSGINTKDILLLLAFFSLSLSFLLHCALPLKLQRSSLVLKEKGHLAVPPGALT